MIKKDVFHTFDEWCLLKLEELGRTTVQKWAKAMGYENTGCMSNIIRRNRNKLIIKNRFYEVKEAIDLKT